jgi:hypothetical protein
MAIEKVKAWIAADERRSTLMKNKWLIRVYRR